MRSMYWVVLVALGLSSAHIDAREPRSRDADYGSQGGADSMDESRGGGRGDSNGGPFDRCNDRPQRLFGVLGYSCTLADSA